MRGSDILEAEFPRGPRNLITDVPGVLVSHVTLKGDGLNTGLTVISPHGGDVYEERVFASYFVLNGFGKSTGLLQIGELGYLETPIVVTGTLNVGIVFDDVVDYHLETHRDLKTVNPVVLECNDSRLSDPRRRHAIKGKFQEAMKSLSRVFELGCVGAGTGMVAFGFKSGVGSSSRIVGDYVLGVLTVPNFGKREELTINGERLFRERSESGGEGSVIIVVATDAPLIPNQLRRLSTRAALGIARVGGRSHNRSGEIVLTFSNATVLKRDLNRVNIEYINDDSKIFQDLMNAVIEATEEAIIDALLNACDTVSYDGKVYEKLKGVVI